MAPLPPPADGAGEDRDLPASAEISTARTRARFAPTCSAIHDHHRGPADVADLWALERAHAVNARYHVLGGTLSPLDGIGPRTCERSTR